MMRGHGQGECKVLVPIGHVVKGVVVGWEPKARGGVVISVGVVVLVEGNRVARC
jgi:hypothetical protein